MCGCGPVGYGLWCCEPLLHMSSDDIRQQGHTQGHHYDLHLLRSVRHVQCFQLSISGQLLSDTHCDRGLPSHHCWCQDKDVASTTYLSSVSSVLIKIGHSFSPSVVRWNPLSPWDCSANQAFVYAVIGSLVGQLLVIYFPLLQAIFDTEALSLWDIITLVCLASTVLIADELRKFVLSGKLSALLSKLQEKRVVKRGHVTATELNL